MSHVSIASDTGVVILQHCSRSQLDHIVSGDYIFQQSLLVVEPLFAVSMLFLMLTVATTLFYYKRIRQASKTYEEARNAVGDVVISFDKQLNNQEAQLGATIQRIEAQVAGNDRLSRRLDEQENRVSAGLAYLNSKITKLPDLESVKTTVED